MAKRTPLVCQHLENVSRRVLVLYQDIVRQKVAERQGVYALYRRGRLYYVGLASDLRTRLAHHLKDRHRDSWDRFSVYLTIGDSYLNELESLILCIVKTPGNKQKGKFAKSEDLHRGVLQDWRAKQRREETEMFGNKPATAEPVRKRSKRTGRTPVLAEHIKSAMKKGAMKLRARFKGQTINARVGRAGCIRLDGKTFTSPSAAAAHACHRPTCDGWTFWQYERAPGDWVPLSKLRPK